MPIRKELRSAAAERAEIPFDLALHIGRVFHAGAPPQTDLPTDWVRRLDVSNHSLSGTPEKLELSLEGQSEKERPEIEQGVSLG